MVKSDTEIHPLVKTAMFSYEFVSIHPFQDGKGRLSRLLATLLLLKTTLRILNKEKNLFLG